jgi:hypothetical protein
LFKGEKKDCLKLNRELGKVAHQESLGSWGSLKPIVGD